MIDPLHSLGGRPIYRHDGSAKALLKGLFAAYAPPSIRLGRSFRRTRKLLKKSSEWSADQMHSYQVGELRSLVAHACQNVPWYQRTFREAGIDPVRITDLADLQRLPLLTKRDLRNATEGEFRATNFEHSRLIRMMSGGTTGAPTEFFHLRDYSDGVFNAYRVSAWEMGGYRFGARAIDLTWAFSGELLRFNPYFNWLSYSISRLEVKSLAPLLAKIKAFRPQFIIGYPSTVTLFAQLLADAGYTLGGLEGVITGSEMCYPAQTQAIVEILGCPVSQWYGLSELAGFAGTCATHGRYHFFPQAGCVELIRDDGVVVTKPGEEGEIVLTGFHTRATPFIRYRTGDRGVLATSCCATPGAGHIVIGSIVGREQDYLQAVDHRVPLSAVNCHTPAFRNVWKYQFVQKGLGRLILRVMPKAGFSAADRQQIEDHLHQRLGAGFYWEIQFVDDIPATQRGKHLFLINETPAPSAQAPSIL